jgi:cobalt-zinc-cadmium efflux system outer membrane protein
MTKFKLALVIFLASIAVSDAEESASLNWDTAVDRVFGCSSRLMIASEEIDERSGIQMESAALPNPIISYSVENVFGMKEWRSWHSAESRYEISQLIELGGKRRYRSQATSYLVCAATAEYDAEIYRTLNRLAKLFLEVAAAQELYELSKKQAMISEEAFKTVKSKVNEGRTSIIQQNKAEISYYTSRIDTEKAFVDWSIAKEKLANMWGESCPDFERVEWPFYELETPDDLEVCYSYLQSHPELVKSQYEYLSALQIYYLEKADKVPNLVVTCGYKTTNDTGNRGLIFGASLPLRVFNKNQGNIQSARSHYLQLEERSKEIQLALESRLMALHKESVRAYNEVDQMKNTILNAADKAFEFSKEGYVKGKFEYLDMLDSQKIQYDIHERYIQALLNYHKSKVDIKYLYSEEV